jgi:regulator of replication initiation timing
MRNSKDEVFNKLIECEKEIQSLKTKVELVVKENAFLKELVHHLASRPAPYPPAMPLVAPHTTTIKQGCMICGVGADGKPYGYVCPRSDCPTRITC